MNFIDIILGIFLAYGLYKGFRKGLVIEVASLVALVLGVYGGIHFSDSVADFLRKQFDWQTEYLHIISFAITFIGIVFIVYTIGKIVEKLINIVALGLVNKIAGGAFGLLKVAFILSVILIIIESFDKKANLINEEKKENSFLYRPVCSFAAIVIPKLDMDAVKNPFKQGEEDDEAAQEGGDTTGNGT